MSGARLCVAFINRFHAEALSIKIISLDTNKPNSYNDSQSTAKRS